MSHLHDYACLNSQYSFQCILSLFRFIYKHVLGRFRILCWFMISILKLLVIACTCMPEPHHFIMYTYECLSTPTGLIIHTRWVAFWQPWILMSRSWSLDRGGLAVLIRVAQQKHGLAVACPDPLSPASPWSARKILILLLVNTFPYFILYILLWRFLVILYS